MKTPVQTQSDSHAQSLPLAAVGHTPGEWYAAGGAIYAKPLPGDINRDHIKVAQCLAADWLNKPGCAVLPVASNKVRVPDSSRPGCEADGCEEAWANARLIAAAPAMLAALERLLLVGDYIVAGTAQSAEETSPERFSQARAAIALAKGGTP